MSGTDPGLFGVAPETEPRDKTEAPDSSELEASDMSLARELLDAKVGRIHVHPIERPESAGFSAVAYKADARRPPRRTEEYPTLPDAKVLVNVTQPLGSAPFPVVQTAPMPVPEADPGERRFAIAEVKRTRAEPETEGQLVVPVRRAWAWWGAGAVLVAMTALWSLRGSSAVETAAKPVPSQVPVPPPVAAASAPRAQPSSITPAPGAPPSAPVVRAPTHAAPVHSDKPKPVPAPPHVPPPSSARATPDPDLPPVKLLDEK